MDNTLSATQQVVQSINHARTTQFSGRWICSSKEGSSEAWFFHFREGKLIWVNQPHHRNRRWLRILRKHCPTYFQEHWPSEFSRLNASGKFIGEYWELTHLTQSKDAGLLEPEQIERIQQAYLTEAVTELSFATQLTQHWINASDLSHDFASPVAQTVFQSVQTSQKQWRILSQKYPDNPRLQQFSLDLAPVITEVESLKAQVDPLVFGQLSKLLTGQNTLWDIASLIQQEWISVASVLLPLIMANSINLQPTDDIKLKAITPASPVSSARSKSRSRGVIACIDDSPVIGKELERMLQPYGFEVLSILDPLKGFTKLMAAKPRFIFLDLVMPNTNGYEICSFLRKSAQFKDLPIVMLTGHDGIVDRLRAKMAGSTDFLGKPPEVTKVLQALEKYLEEDLLTVSKPSSKKSLDELPA